MAGAGRSVGNLRRPRPVDPCSSQSSRHDVPRPRRHPRCVPPGTSNTMHPCARRSRRMPASVPSPRGSFLEAQQSGTDGVRTRERRGPGSLGEHPPPSMRMRWSASSCASDRSFVHSSTLHFLRADQGAPDETCMCPRAPCGPGAAGFVEEQELGPAQQRPGHQQLLLHAGRIQAERLVRLLFQAHLAEHLAHPLPPGPAFQAMQRGEEVQVLLCRRGASRRTCRSP